MKKINNCEVYEAILQKLRKRICEYVMELSHEGITNLIMQENENVKCCAREEYLSMQISN